MPDTKLQKGGRKTVANESRKIKKVKRSKKGLEVERLYTEQGKNPLDLIEYELRSCKIEKGDKVVFELNDIEMPSQWSKVATDILISKYLRRNGVPQYDKLGNVILDKDGKNKIGAEQSIKQVVSRIAGCWRWWGEKYSYFASDKDAQAFEDELKFMLVNQYGAPNSPQWFNTGLALAYDIKGTPQGHWYADPKSGKLKQSEDAYSHPQPHACFIQSVKDDLVNEGGIFDLVTREARIFKYGSGSGTNFSSIRGAGEPLSGGGQSSGLMSFLQILDRAAGAVKSGGTTRRAAKMVILNIDHPDAEEFINWKYKEEQKAASLMAAGYTGGIEGEAYQTVSGQNSNNSIRLTDDFMRAVESDGEWHLRYRTDPTKISRTIKAKKLWDEIAKCGWSCGDPGLQFDTTVNDWNTCLGSGRINGSNPCSEFMFLDDSSCNLASLNLVKFYNEKTGEFKVEEFKHATRLWTMVLEISVLMAQFPSYEIAKNSYLYRPLGLGYANLGALLMIMGLPYDSEEGRAVSAGITSLMTASSYSTSAEMSKNIGPFSQYEKNKDHMLRVIRNHRRAAYDAAPIEFEQLSVLPQTLKDGLCPENIVSASREEWDKALLSGGQWGFRNAQVTLLAPTGTIGLSMDCDTTGIEPDYAIVKFKKLIGGGYFKIINQSVPKALKRLGYTAEQIDDIINYIVGTGSFKNAPHINRTSLSQKGLTDEEILRVEGELKGSFSLSQAIDFGKLSPETLKRIGISDEKIASKSFTILEELGFSNEQIIEANDHICGRMTIEGAPHIEDEHLPIFDCANRCGANGTRFIKPEGHVEMMSAVQPFLSGAISKTVNLPNEATQEDVERIHMAAWKGSIKALAIYRDGSKISQPLATGTSSESKTENKVQKEIVVEYRPVRKRLPKERASITRKVNISGHKIYLTVGLYPDGKPGELFIVMNKQGSFAAGMADSFAKMVSIGMQYGVPVETIVNQLRHMRFQPMGFTGDSDITNVASITDFIAVWLKKLFVDQEVKAVKLPFDNEDEPDTITAKTSVKPVQLAHDETAKNESANLSKQSIFKEELGYSGETCPECGSASMVQNGKCLKCVNCGTTTGCS